jgi:hypothetical protein
MAQSIWHEKVGTVLITIMLTGIGSVALQSAKYMSMDFADRMKHSEERFQAKLALENGPWEYWKKFNEVREPISKNDTERSQILSASLKELHSGPININKLEHALDMAYGDLGSISYAPVFGATMEGERATFTQDLKIQIEGLELLYDFAQGPKSVKELLKLRNGLERNTFHRSQSLRAEVSALNASQFESDRNKKASDEAIRQYKSEMQEHNHWLNVSGISLMASLIAYGLLLHYLTFGVKAKKDTQEKAASAAQAT